uniref:UBA domain-containing protein n=2 Tax=Graphocephala atropunctata TaxID=36148 RepID=A0A1B6LNZ7_9HEMI
MIPPTQSETIRETSPTAAHTRRNSDDWTFLNRESPVRSEVARVMAMEIDESRGARPKSVYPELPKETLATPSAPPQSDSVFSDVERQRIQEAVERINSMGFNFDSVLLRELLRRENCDIASVLELILTNAAGKK